MYPVLLNLHMFHYGKEHEWIVELKGNVIQLDTESKQDSHLVHMSLPHME